VVLPIAFRLPLHDAVRGATMLPMLQAMGAIIVLVLIAVEARWHLHDVWGGEQAAYPPSFDLP
jgi:hypothetical protein